MGAEYNLNKLKDINQNIFCNKCNTETKHKLLTGINLTSFDGGQHEPTFWTNYDTIQCYGCTTISFRIGESNSEEFDFISGKPELGFPVVRYEYLPKRLYLKKEISKSKIIPPVLIKIYCDVIKAFESNLEYFTAIGIRMIIEKITIDYGASKRGLEGKIRQIHDKGIITEEECLILIKVKDIGNDYAHFNRSHSRNTIKSAIKIIELMLEKIFHLPEHVKSLDRP